MNNKHKKKIEKYYLIIYYFEYCFVEKKKVQIMTNQTSYIPKQGQDILKSCCIKQQTMDEKEHNAQTSWN